MLPVSQALSCSSATLSRSIRYVPNALSVSLGAEQSLDESHYHYSILGA